MRKSRLAGLAAFGGVLAVFATAAAPAMADTDSLTCAFNGLAGTASPNVPDVLNTVNKPLQTGGFTFGGTGTCALVDTDGTVAAGSANISAAGNFLNVVCGTGTATGTGTITPSSALLPQLGWGNHTSASSSFTIAFVAGNGAMVMQNASDGSDGDTLPLGAGAGYVNIVPDINDSQGSNCINVDVAHFLVNGAFSAEA